MFELAFHISIVVLLLIILFMNIVIWIRVRKNEGFSQYCDNKCYGIEDPTNQEYCYKNCVIDELSRQQPQPNLINVSPSCGTNNRQDYPLHSFDATCKGC